MLPFDNSHLVLLLRCSVDRVEKWAAENNHRLTGGERAVLPRSSEKQHLLNSRPIHIFRARLFTAAVFVPSCVLALLSLPFICFAEFELLGFYFFTYL